MRVIGKIFKWLLWLIVVAVIGGAVWLWIAPPVLIRVAANYTAKIVCSNVFLAGRDAGQVLAVDVQAPGHPILKLMMLNVDKSGGTVSAGLLGIFGKGTAVLRPGLGCTDVPDGNVAAAKAISTDIVTPPTVADALWPEGGRVEPSQNPEIAKILDDAGLTGPGMRAVVVAQNGRILGERYGAGFSENTPLLGWSMTKSVNAAIVGTLVKEGKLAITDQGLFADWKADKRAAVTLADMMAMSSGLEFNEDYGAVTDVTRMLYQQGNMADFASNKPLTGEPGKVYSYSSGTAVMLSRIWQNTFADPKQALAWPRQKLFEPIGMNSGVLETDQHGTFVGSSYLYATARDWARFGQFLLQDGAWNGQQILPDGFVSWMREPAPASKNVYTRGQLWIEAPGNENDPGATARAGVPADTYWLEGHDGQTVAVVPSQKLVVVRLGLTPFKLGYRPQNLTAALAKVLK